MNARLTSRVFCHASRSRSTRGQGQLCSLSDDLRLFDDDPVEIFAEAFGDPLGLDRADPLDVRVVGQIVGQAVGVEFEVVGKRLDLELAPVLGMRDPAALENDLILLAGVEFAREGNFIAG